MGWAADGFPIYTLYGYSNGQDAKSGVKKLKSSYRLKKGQRPSGGSNPGGSYDGTFVGDYTYQAGLGDLDDCNGQAAVTPEFPKGTYAYFLTQTWPVIPRCFKGTPDRSFQKQRISRRGGRGGQGRRVRPGGGRFGPPPGGRHPPFGPPPHDSDRPPPPWMR